MLKMFTLNQKTLTTVNKLPSTVYRMSLSISLTFKQEYNCDIAIQKVRIFRNSCDFALNFNKILAMYQLLQLCLQVQDSFFLNIYRTTWYFNRYIFKATSYLELRYIADIEKKDSTTCIWSTYIPVDIKLQNCISSHNFLKRGLLLTRKLFNQWFLL